ncbi:hypothetical protein EDB86DRAFT_3244538, partial [Lactarius hatsudake]
SVHLPHPKVCNANTPTLAVHPHPSSSPTFPPPRADPFRPVGPRHEDAVIASGPKLSSLTWPITVRCHARHPVRCVGASLCRGRVDKREVVVRLHPHAAQGCPQGQHCAARA